VRTQIGELLHYILNLELEIFTEKSKISRVEIGKYKAHNTLNISIYVYIIKTET